MMATVPPIYAVDIGGSFMKFAVSAEPGALRMLDRIETPAGSWPDFVSALSSLVKRHVPADQAAAPLALSIAGLIDPKDGVATSANIPCITGRSLARELSVALSRPVFAANDADCLTLAEANEGVGRGHAVVFCAIMGTGIGGGLAIDGRLVKGAGGVTGEWGHAPVLNTTVDFGKGGTVHVPRFYCGCGQSGCVDTIGGARGMERLHTFLHGEGCTSHEILDAWSSGDAKADGTMTAYLQLLADPLSLVVNITGASIVPVGGGLASEPKLIAALDAAVRKRILNRFDHPLVVPAIRQDDGGLVGAAVLARQEQQRAAA
ncbi:N-acetylglucosamine kinase [Neorhizobium huautlense]|uniref:N-acetylglucosamine kinase n=1 Tax=Neorhizobium huautlense TaxID=67774 RepID=A0ABT9PV92_9HYPH|nr:ROK family protein [Neorhizobium huautlense]MDP9838390.1 N-acetylglucosamine kinase [Neorhizobium huautlense]